MSTRKLILTALALGMAILVAGSVQLLRLSSSDSSAAQVFKIGQSATVGVVVATVNGAASGSNFDVEMEQPSGSGPLEFPDDRWSLQIADRQLTAVPSLTECADPVVTAEMVVQTCTLGFEVPDGTQGTRYLRFAQDGGTATWVIES